MKQISTAAAIILLVVATAFFMRDKSARQQLTGAHKQIAGLSNEVAKVNTLMVVHGTTNAELKQQLVKYLERMAGLSNHLARTSEDLKQTRQQHQTVQSDLTKETKKAADGEVRIAELENEVRVVRKMNEGRESEIVRLREILQEAQIERAAYHDRVQKAEADLVKLQLDLTDSAALRAQLNRLKKQWPPVGFATAPHVQAEGKGAKALTAKVNDQATGYQLQIQPDGTVKLVPALGATK